MRTCIESDRVAASVQGSMRGGCSWLISKVTPWLLVILELGAFEMHGKCISAFRLLSKVT